MLDLIVFLDIACGQLQDVLVSKVLREDNVRNCTDRKK